MTLRQPKRGDVLLECAHIDGTQKVHWYQTTGPDGTGGFPFTRLDGTEDEADWIILCVDCHRVFADHNNDLDSIEIVDDSIYDGDGEVIQGTN